jgi:hypothetical protein
VHMADRLIRILEQGKLILRGVKPRGRAIVANQDENETLTYTVNWSTWLGTDTIASVTNETSGITVSAASNTTTTATFKLSGNRSGWLEHRITTAGGLTKELLVLLEIDGYPIRDDYGLSWQVVG